MLVAPPGGAPVLLDFMVAAPGEGERSPLEAVVIDFGDAVQIFHIGASSCGVYGMPAGVASAAERFGTVPLEELAAPAIALARDGVRVNATQAYLWELLGPIATSTPESCERYCV
jgi:gamma-glutamyltranspeptidase/glutathione hydrolase